MLKKFILPILIVSGLVISGCSSTGDIKDGEGATVEDISGATGQGSQGQGPGTDAAGASASGLPGQAPFQGHPLDNPASPLATRTIYFDYDSSEIKPEYQESILAHGRYLAENPDSTLTIEGHTDERGSREYNIGLGERRAQAVRRLLLFQGASIRRLKTRL